MPDVRANIIFKRVNNTHENANSIRKFIGCLI